MGILTSPELETTSQAVHVLMDMYSEIGDYIALQYGGSEAHKKVASAGATANPASTNVPSIGKHKEFLTSVRRYYSNTFTDRMKQDAMNLFLGYFIPSQSSVPMWELENDYYLHNFHVQNGSVQSMENFRRNQDDDLYDLDDEVDDESKTSDDSSKVSKEKKKHRTVIGRGGHKIKKLAKRSLSPMQQMFGKADGPDALKNPTADVEEDEKEKLRREATERTLRVRRQCARQSELLSSWWRVAVQTYLQQRMWMHNDQPAETKLPAVFERLYQPHQLTQFDNYFAHAWATPSRAGAGYVRTKNAGLRSQMSGGSTTFADDDDRDDATVQTLNTTATEYVYATKLGLENAGSTVGSYMPAAVRKFGSKAKSMLSLKSKDQLDYRESSLSDVNGNDDPEHGMVGKEGSHTEYESYVADGENPQNLVRKWNMTAYKEFTESLADINLPPDEVDGIRKLAESAHVTREIQKGPYEGLLQDTSAHEVATLKHEMMDVLASSEKRDNEEEGKLFVQKTLERNGMSGSAVCEIIGDSWEDLKMSRVVNGEIIDPVLAKQTTSALSTVESVELYKRMCFAEDDDVVEGALAGGDGAASETGRLQSKGGKGEADEGTVIAPRGRRGRFKVAREGFEQIKTDDLYFRTKNKFMKFNGVGMEDWCTRHKTRRIEEDSYFEKVFGGSC
jgi:hypothetical protein